MGRYAPVFFLSYGGTWKTRPRNVPALAPNGLNFILTRWHDTRSPCRARTYFLFFFGHGIGANGAAAKEGLPGPPF